MFKKIDRERFREQYGRLNDEQKKAVDIIDGPLLILAGPGTGKTQLLSIRAVNILLEREVEPENILILTFTNAATRAMRERLALIAGHIGYNVTVETFHGFANSVVLESEGAINFIRDKIELTDVEKARALKYILDNVKGVESLRPFGAPYIHRGEIEKRISELKNEGIPPEEFKREVELLSPFGAGLEEKHIERLRAVAVIYEHYEKLKDKDAGVLFDERGRIDYDDMILTAVKALRENDELRGHFSEKYRYIMVDEYQDTNGVQLELLFSVMDPGTMNICCVGDDDQSIYRFQGATLSNFRALREKMPALREVDLVNNYRSTPEIIKVSEDIIAGLPAGERVAEKRLRSLKDYRGKDIRYFEFLTEEEELLFLAGEIRAIADGIRNDDSLSREERMRPYNNIAVLVRTRAQIEKVINVFLKEGMPYATDGKENIRGEKRVGQLLDALELANMGPEDAEGKALTLYKMLTADYAGVFYPDLLKFMAHVEKMKSAARREGDLDKYYACGFFGEFQKCFDADVSLRPGEEDSRRLEISKRLELEVPHALHAMSWAIKRLVSDAQNRPVHDILLRYIENAGMYGYILKSYKEKEVLKIRDLRAVASFVNMIKSSDLAYPGMGLRDFMEEMELREIQGMPVRGELATMNQDGVRVYTAHGSKGLEFYAVFMPFCLDKKSWPSRGKNDVVPLPPEISGGRERIDEKGKLKLLKQYDELRLFYVASTRARAYLTYTATPAEKAIASPFLLGLDIEPRTGTPVDEAAFLAEFLKKRPREDLLTATSAALAEMVGNMALTPTKLNTYISCRRKFLYNYVLALPGRKNQHLTFGNCAHKALEEVYRYFMKREEFPAFEYFRKAFMKELAFQGVTSSIRNWCLDRLKTLEPWYKHESRRPVMPQSLEKDLVTILDGGVVFKGKFDKIESLGEGRVKVVDYKTGSPDTHIKAIKYTGCLSLASHECDDYYRQLVAYKLVYDRSNINSGGHKAETGTLQFLEPVSKTVKKYDMEKGEYRNIEVDLTDDMAGELEKVILGAWKDIQGLKFEKLAERDDKDRCSRCEYD
ncbi:MAG: ATP-dependent DNA helicase, partial [Candidatus Omnitrophota bacterium]